MRHHAEGPRGPSRICKKPAGKAGTSKDPRTNFRWLWLGIAVGKGKKRYTHSNGLKRIAFEWLPSKELAPKGGPRGSRSMKGVVKRHVKQKSFCVFDGWFVSKALCVSLGYKHAPPAKHDAGWRDRRTGYHSNDAESENARLKSWLRGRYTKLSLTFTKKAQEVEYAKTDEEAPNLDPSVLPDMYEYLHYINVGKTMDIVMKSVALAAGGCAQRANPARIL